MRVEVLGSGEPEIAVVGGIHGDEPCGVAAVERLLEERPDVDRAVKLVVANEEAVARGVRFVDVDLNRAFPGDPDAADHERRLATRLAEELRGCRTLSLHSTQSHPEPFAIVDTVDDMARSVCPRLPIAAVVETGPFVEGRLVAAPGTIEAECGLQGSAQAAENAHELVRAYLAACDALPDPSPPHSVPVFRLNRALPKEHGREGDHDVRVRNFQQVEAGEVYAATGSTEYRAESGFYPVLLSAEGYAELFGYAAERVGTLSEANN